MAYDAELADRVRRVLATRRDVTEKHMFGGVAFMVNGHMACGLMGDVLMVRVGVAEHAALLEEPHVRPMDFTGRPMKGYLYVDPPGIASPRDLATWVNRATRYVESLPAKTVKTNATTQTSQRRRASRA